MAGTDSGDSVPAAAPGMRSATRAYTPYAAYSVTISREALIHDAVNVFR